MAVNCNQQFEAVNDDVQPLMIHLIERFSVNNALNFGCSSKQFYIFLEHLEYSSHLKQHYVVFSTFIIFFQNP